MMTSCSIHLDSSGHKYVAGTAIEGRVVFVHPKIIHIKEVKIMFQGEEHTEWTEMTTYRDRYDEIKNLNIAYRGDKEVYGTTVIIAGRGYCEGQQNEYPFRVIVPSNMPESYNGKYGWIKYILTARVVITRDFFFENARGITVEAPFDLNKIHSVSLGPHEYSDETTIKHVCWGSELITMDVYFEKKAFIPGEIARIKVDLTNMSNRNIDKVTAQMGMIIVSKSTDPRAMNKTEYFLVDGGSNTGVGAHGTRTLFFQLRLPLSLKVTNFNSSTLFHQLAGVKVEAFISDRVKLKVEAPVFLGHVPIEGPDRMRTLFNQENIQTQSPLPSAPLGASPTAPTAEFVPDAPPSYDQVTAKAPSYDEVTAYS